jgi:hypothetical protein
MPTVVAIRKPKQGDLVYSISDKNILYSLLKDTGNQRYVYISLDSRGIWIARGIGNFNSVREVLYETDQWDP